MKNLFQVFFGNVYVPSEVLTSHAMKVVTPSSVKGACVVEITLMYKSRHVFKGSPGRFMYTGTSE